jgi:hypothetical protein
MEGHSFKLDLMFPASFTVPMVIHSSSLDIPSTFGLLTH